MCVKICIREYKYLFTTLSTYIARSVKFISFKLGGLQEIALRHKATYYIIGDVYKYITCKFFTDVQSVTMQRLSKELNIFWKYRMRQYLISIIIKTS